VRGETDEAFAVGTASHPRVPGTAFEAATAGGPPSVEPATRAVEPLLADRDHRKRRGIRVEPTDGNEDDRLAHGRADYRRGEHRQHRDRLDADGDDRRDEQRPRREHLPTSAPSSANTTKTATAP